LSTIPTTKGLGDYASLIRRRWHYPGLIIPAGLLAAVFIAYILPVSYRGSATIMQQGASLPTDLVPTTVAKEQDAFLDATQQLELARRRVMTKDSLKEIVRKIDPYPNDKDLDVATKASMISADTDVERVDPITLQASEVSMAFAIRYSNSDPKLAAEVTNQLADLFLTYNRRSRAEQAGEALKFLQAQAQSLEGSMEEMERRLAQFKAKYGDALPEAQARNLAGADRAYRDIEMLDRDVRAAEQQQALLTLQLNETSPSLTAAVSDWRTELAKLRGELATAEQKYTPEHPDVKRLRRAVADLVAQGGATAAAESGKPDNPEYLRIQGQLRATQRELEALRANAARARADRENYERNLAGTPNVEREYVRLAREYENSQHRYQDLQEKIKAAALAQTMESEERGERFTLLQAASTPSTPAAPNRLGIILLGFVLSCGVGLGAAVLMDASDPCVRGVDDLESIMGTTPFGAVPVILNAAGRRRVRGGHSHRDGNRRILNFIVEAA
jgi:polysaccharide chain length determinant protein (PEP-CTERM system associated)